jgi:polygalacturonase
MMDPGWWTNFIHSSNNVTYDGVKIITEKAVFNGDGVDVDSSTNVTVKNVFVHNGDDAFCVKTKDLLGIKGPSNNVRFENNVIGYSLRAAKIGTETVAGGNMTNITFKNFESVQLAQHNAIITVQDGNTVDGVTFDSLKVDSGKKPFILEIKKRNASSSVGLIRNVWLKNLSVPAVTENSPINGYDSAHKIKTVTICNFKKGGVVKTTLGTAGIVPNTFTTGVTISGTCP